MAEQIIIQGESKEEKYLSLLPQLKALVKDEDDITANLANITSALKYSFGFFWVGFYLVKGDQLVLGPFQGNLACTRIGFGKGVCGTAWKLGETLIIDDVDKFPGHIACSSEARSEIAVPIFNMMNKVAGILDIDEDTYAQFNSTDKEYLEKITGLIRTFI